jgi:hypothetical protein
MSKCTLLSLERLVRIGVLHAQELARWRAPDLEPFPDPKGGEIFVFEEYFTHGFGVPVRDENGTDIFRPYSRPNSFRGVLIRPYPSPDI